MSRSIQVGSAPADPGFAVNPNIGDVQVKASGSNQVNVAKPMPGHNPAPHDPVPSGAVEMRKTLSGETVVKAGGLEMSLKEAQSLGIVGPDGAPGQTPGGPSGKPEAVPGDAGDTAGVTEADVVAHAAELNAVGGALEAAGINAEDALSRVVAAFDSGELPDDVSEAMIAQFGEEDAQAIVSNALDYVAGVAGSAIKGAGLNANDAAQMEALSVHLANQPALWIGALRGQPQALNNAVFAFAAKRR